MGIDIGFTDESLSHCNQFLLWVNIHPDVRALPLYTLRLTVRGRSLEKFGHLFQVLCLWIALPSLPTPKSAGVNTQGFCQLLLGYAKKATVVDYLFTQSLRLSIKRHRDVMSVGERCTEVWVSRCRYRYTHVYPTSLDNVI
jgi:hypothetical protein